MNNKNYSGKDTVPFKVNPFKINSSRKEKKKRNLIFDIFPLPFFSFRPFENSLKRRKKKGGGIRNSSSRS